MTIKEQIKVLDNQLKSLNNSRHTLKRYYVKRDRVNKKFIIMKEEEGKTIEFSEKLDFEEAKDMIKGMKKLKFFFL